MSYELVAILITALPTYAGLAYLIYRAEVARRTFTPGEAAIFKEMRRVLEERP